MTENADNPFEQLERIFHEPNRLSIMSALCASRQGLAFGELRDTCALTDGNLNRHLKTLSDAGAVEIDKEFVGVKPRTTVRISKLGLERFNEYLGALTEVLEAAREALPGEQKTAAAPPLTEMKAKPQTA
ncbi:MAG: transcriptional regulator [Lentisphaerae bacterium]|nr:transcriptional regulator [Lentisphaerota bacterium]